MSTLRSKFHLVSIGAIEKAQAMENTQRAANALTVIHGLVWESGAITGSEEQFISAVKKSSILLSVLNKEENKGVPYLIKFFNTIMMSYPKEFNQLSEVVEQKQKSQSKVSGLESSGSQKEILSSLASGISDAKIKAQGKASPKSDDFNQDMTDYIASFNHKTNLFLELKLTEEEIKLFEQRGLCDTVTNESMWMPVIVRGKTMNLSHVTSPSIRKDESGTRICPLTNRPFQLNAIQPALDTRASIDELFEHIKQNRKKDSSRAATPEVPLAIDDQVKGKSSSATLRVC